MKTRLLVVAVMLCWVIPGVAQQDGTQPSRDQLAVAAVTQALSALGISSNQPITDCTATGTSARPDGSRPSAFTWKSAGKEFRSDLSNSKSTAIIVTGHGNAAMERNGETRKIPYHVAQMMYPFFLPGVILSRILNDSNYSISDARIKQLNGVSLIRVQIVNQANPITATVSKQEWYFDPTTSLPVAVRYHVPDRYDALAPERKRSEVLKVFSQYTQVNQVLMPYHIRTTEDGDVREAQVSSLVCNTGIPPSVFDLTSGGGQ